MEIGSLVAPKSGRDQLASGCSVYDCAVVVSLQPFVLISELGDMRWSATIRQKDFDKVGTASPHAARAVLDRIGRDAETAGMIEAGAIEALRAIVLTHKAQTDA